MAVSPMSFTTTEQYPALAGKGFIELGKPVVKFPSDNGFGIESIRRILLNGEKSGVLQGIGFHLRA